MTGECFRDERIRKARLFDAPYAKPGPVQIQLTWAQTDLLRDMLEFCETEYEDGRDRAMARRIRANLNAVEIATLSTEALFELQASPQRRLLERNP